MTILRNLISRILSPLSASRPTLVRQTRERNCSQTVVAIAASRPLEVVERMAGTDGAMTVRETLNLLERFGLPARPVDADLFSEFWDAFYTRNGGRRMRAIGLKLPAEKKGIGHAVFIWGGQVFDPATGHKEPFRASTARDLDWIAVLPSQPVKPSPRGRAGVHKARAVAARS